ncbi:MAG TPA: hypothetical protein VND21_02410 [Planctomycetota bacterium]|nr:hypothetical protein [Planctomycetota bacterium]
MKHLLACVGLVILALLGATALRSASAGDPEVHEDPDYRFRIRRPDATWRLLSETEAKSLVADAIAGLSDSRGAFFAVIVEEVGEGGLDEITGLLRDELRASLEGAELSEPEGLTVAGMPARRWSSRGHAQRVFVQYRHVVVLRGRFAYQLVGWCQGDADRERLDALARHFTFTEGEVRPRAQKQSDLPVRGVGWRIQDGVYQDPVNGLEWAPPPGWRLAVGTELSTMSDSACVGLVCGDPDAYVTVTSEAAQGVDAKGLADLLRSQVTSSNSPVGKPSSLIVGGRDFSMQTVRIPAQLPFLLHHGVRVDAGRAVQVLWWSAEGLAERARPRVLEAVKSLRFLDAARREALAAQLRGGPDPQEQVGPGYALRSGVYRDFQRGFTWTKPPGYWVATSGQEARAINEDAILHVSDASTGVEGIVTEDEFGSSDPKALHAALVQVLEPVGAVPEPSTILLPGATALSTEVRTGAGAGALRHVVTSVVRGMKVFQARFSGLDGNVAAARAQVAAALRGFAFPGAVPEVERRDGDFVDHRLGFRLRKPPGEGWRLGNATAPALRPLGSMVLFSRADATVLAGGVHAHGVQMDDRLLRDLAMQVLRREVKGAPEPTESADTVAGLPAKRLEAGGNSPMVAWILQRRHTIYILVVGEPAKVGMPADELSGLIQLLE